jgi:hypothetical protein
MGVVGRKEAEKRVLLGGMNICLSACVMFAGSWSGVQAALYIS